MGWTVRDSEELARELLNALPTRWAHVQRVALQAGTIVGDAPHVRCAAWLHDIGYAPGVIDKGMHAIDGALFLDREGVPQEIVSLVAFHTGAEFEADERGLMHHLTQFDRPPQPDLDALILADLTSGPSGENMSVEERLDEIFTRYEPQHPVHRAVTRSRGYLEACCQRALAVCQPM